MNQKKQLYQLENPNNARITIDYLNKEKPVSFHYIGKESNFKIVWRLFFYKYMQYFLPLIVLGCGFVYYLIVFSRSINIFFGTYLLFLIIYGIPLFLTFLFITFKPLLKLIPYIYSFGSKYYLVVFDAGDIKDNKIEIPLFKNVFLNYHATKEFSKYLIKYEAIEHEFNYKLNNKKYVKNPYLWKAVFTFSEPPKTGLLFVRFS